MGLRRASKWFHEMPALCPRRREDWVLLKWPLKEKFIGKMVASGFGRKNSLAYFTET
jgi:hypothetical protein